MDHALERKAMGNPMKKIKLLPIVIGIGALLVMLYFHGYIFQPSFSLTHKLVYDPIIVEGKVVCIVFDDGFKGQLEVVPILDSFGFKATFAIVVRYVDGNFPLYFSWDQVKYLADKGMDIESHSYSHKHLNSLTSSELNFELAESKKILGSHGYETEIFVYPFGEYNNMVYEAVSNHYLCARGITNSIFNVMSGDRYAINAFGISNSTSMETFQSHLVGVRNSNISVLYYHRICLSVFYEEMKYLKDNNFTVMTMKDVFLREW